jgi:hypothetical protein
VSDEARQALLASKERLEAEANGVAGDPVAAGQA